MKQVLIKDYKSDTLIAANRITTSILDIKKVLDGDLLFGTIRADGLYLNLKYYKGSKKDTNLDKFIELFETGKPSTKPFFMSSDKIILSNSKFLLSDENNKVPVDLSIKSMNGVIKQFKIIGPNVFIDVTKLSFLDANGLFVENVTTTFSYTKKQMRIDKLHLKTRNSFVHGYVIMNYDRKDMSNFINKVQFDVKIDSSNIATADLNCFYNEFSKTQHYSVKTKFKGTLNNFKLINLHVKDIKITQIIGNVTFKNIFGKEKDTFSMDGDFEKVASNYTNLTVLLPSILGKNLPSSLKTLGQFNFKGTTFLTTSFFKTAMEMKTELGFIQSNLELSNIKTIDKASYVGTLILDNFDLGTFLNRKEVRKVSLDVNVVGKGFTEQYLKTSFDGTVSKMYYNGYTYTNILTKGNFEKPIFNGQIVVNDPNLKMNFLGTIDLNAKSNIFDFKANIDHANLKKMNILNDSISNFKGDFDIKIKGNSWDNLEGKVDIKNTAYQNTKDTYKFTDFDVQSSFDDNKVRTISINSPDIVEGKIVGKFHYLQLRKMLENSAGSLYTNYHPNKIDKGQFMKFDFRVNNKFIDILFPEVAIGKNTEFHGAINSDNDDFKFNFNSSQIVAYNNFFDHVKVSIDNKNPIFNTFIEMDSIRTKHYKVRDFSLINVTMKDTLYVRTEFKGGSKGEDVFNLNIFHTIDANNKNVIGLKKSDVKFKNNLWYFNEKDAFDNKMIFDKNMHEFTFDNFVLSHENEEISFYGNLQSKTNKDLKINFKEVDLTKISPEIEKFKLEGLLNGLVNIKQKEQIYQPTSCLQIEELKINAIKLGLLNIDISGDDSFSNFGIKSTLKNDGFESFSANGNLNVVNNKSQLDLDLNFNKFNLGILSGVGGSVITKIRGFANGTAKLSGNILAPEIDGKLTIENAGLKIPYLNTDYAFQDNSEVSVSTNQFRFNSIQIKDTKYFTTGVLNGAISHKNFGDWKLDLNVKSDNIVAIDTKESDDAIYYGTAFIKGEATISGPTDALFINVNAKSNKNTSLKIPINNSETMGDNNYIHFLNPKEKYNLKRGIVENRNYNGLELNFDLDITKDAEIEVILNKESGHKMIGSGYGTINLSINTLGKFNIFGDFKVYDGKYFFKYGGLINKTFDVKKGGYINWSGDPMRADINLEAEYKNLIANPGVLLENPSFNKKVPVVVTIGIKGKLNVPDPDFNIDFPTVSSVLKSEIQTKLDDKDVRQKQALILLSTGGFLSAEGLNQSSLVTSNLFEKASSLFDDLFQDKDSKVKLGVAYNAADKSIAGTQTTGRFDVNFTTQVNERISINGKLGVPVGGVNESAIVGNVEVQYRVNEDGTLNLRMYNRENDINYIGEGIGYTQGLGISYEVDFDTFKELINKLTNKKGLDPEKKAKIKDSIEKIEKPNYINFPSKKNDNKNNQKVIIQGVLNDKKK